MSEPVPAHAHIKFDQEGRPFIEAMRCRACGAVVAEARLACPACAARETLEPFRATETGVLRAYSIVQRSFPGVETPFISAVVDLDGGPTLKANLVGVAFEPAAIKPNQRVRLRFNDALGRRDTERRSYVAYDFQPEAAP